MANHSPIEYEKLPTILRRYKPEDKIHLAEKYSRIVMKPDDHSNPSKLRKLPLPWELECFVSLALKAEEWKYDPLEEDYFIRIMNGIREADHPELHKREESFDYARWVTLVLSATQFDYMESFWHKLYRFTYYFNYVSEKINMPEEFRKKFGIDYQYLSTFTLALWDVYIAEVEEISSHIKELIEKHPIEVSLLTLDRKDFIAELDKVTSDPVDYIYCLRPSYSYPFVRCDRKTYLPLPHLLIRASTASLMFRLTNGNDRLREIVGKEVLEAYLFHILSSYPEFDQAEGEIQYTKGKLQNQKSVDVMTHIGDQIICFESKSFVPKVALRIFSEEAYTAEVVRLGKAVKQMYEHVHNKFGVEYNPFDVDVKEDKSNIWGLIVISENPYIHLSDVYTEAKNQLNEDINDEDFEWLQGHVGIISLSSLEHQIFSSDDILSVVQRNAQTKSYNDHWFTNVKTKADSVELKTFKKKQTDIVTQKLLALSCAFPDQ